MERRPLVIVGAGPAGTATALFLQGQDPRLAGEALILEKARHPRQKVCAGGLIPHTLQCLAELGVALSVPAVTVHRASVAVPGCSLRYEGHDLCCIVRRSEFDYSLVQACRQRGVEVREDEKVVALRRENDGVRIETTRGEYHARVVVGADGSGSVVRRRLVSDAGTCVGRAVMCDVPAKRTGWNGFAEARYDFSFLPRRRGLRGYAWAFPCLIGGEPHVNLGVYSLQARGAGRLLRQLLEDELARAGAPQAPMKSFPIRWYGRRTRLTVPHVLLAGDAAGAEPLMGEGISFAFEYGRRAAAAACCGLATGDVGFSDYERAVAGSWMGKKLRRLGLATHLFYGPTWPLWFAVAARSRQAQEIGIRWYNGVDGWDRCSAWHAARAWFRGNPQPARTH
ncbi:MAG: NAD(P)/FAD-dependent oxidoreductase [Candidatus Binatia bacterium]